MWRSALSSDVYVSRVEAVIGFLRCGSVLKADGDRWRSRLECTTDAVSACRSSIVNLQTVACSAFPSQGAGISDLVTAVGTDAFRCPVAFAHAHCLLKNIGQCLIEVPREQPVFCFLTYTANILHGLSWSRR